MSLVSEIREDLRIARINNSPYAALSWVLDGVSVLFKLLLLCVFCYGIWYVLYGTADPYRAVVSAQLPLPTATIEKPAAADVEPLTAERVALLKSLATRSNETPAASDQSRVATASVETSPKPATGILPVDDSVRVFAVEDNAEPQPFVVTDEIVQAALPEPAPDLPLDADTATSADTEALDPAIVAALPRVAAVSTAATVDTGALVAAVTPAVESNVDDPLIRPLEPGDPVASEVRSAAVSASIPVEPGTTVEDRDNNWILAQPEDSFLIQIGSTANRPFLVRFAQQFNDYPTSIYLFRLRRAARNEYGLSVGIFPDKLSAEAALAALPQQARRYGAFVRDVESVQKQIRDADIALSLSTDLPETQ